MSRQFVIIPAMAFFDKRLSAMQVQVLGALAYHTDRNGWCFPGVQTLADRVGCSHSAVSKAIAALERLGYVEVLRNKRKGNRYHVVSSFPDVPERTTDVPNEEQQMFPQEEQERDHLTRPLKKDIDHQVEFDQFWLAYPRRVARGAAEKAFAKARSIVGLDVILGGVENYKLHKPEYADWAHASTWLNQKRWSDDYGNEGTGNRNNGRTGKRSSTDLIFDELAERAAPLVDPGGIEVVA